MTNSHISNVVREKFDFEVSKRPLVGPCGEKTELFGIFRDDTDDFVGGYAVTDKYEPHTTDDVVTLVEAAQAVFENAVGLRCHFKTGHHVEITPTDGMRKAIYGTNDNIFPRLLISAGYDGKFRATLGYFRDSCSNLAIMHAVAGSSSALIHVGSLRKSMPRLIQQFSSLKDSWGNIAEFATRMEQHRVSLHQYVSDVFGVCPDIVAEPKRKGSATRWNKRFETIKRRADQEVYATGRQPSGDYSLWIAFNAIQGYIQHDAPRRNNPDDFDRVLKAAQCPYVKRAEQIARKMVS
jgi:hypothetical protein